MKITVKLNGETAKVGPPEWGSGPDYFSFWSHFLGALFAVFATIQLLSIQVSKTLSSGSKDRFFRRSLLPLAAPWPPTSGHCEACLPAPCAPHNEEGSLQAEANSLHEPSTPHGDPDPAERTVLIALRRGRAQAWRSRWRV